MPDPKPPTRRNDRFDWDDDAAPGIVVERATDEEHEQQKQKTAEAEARIKSKPPG